MTETGVPILEFDATSPAIINPMARALKDNPVKGCVFCFFQEVIERLTREGTLCEVGALQSEIGRNPIYRMERGCKSILVLHPGVGAPLAAAFLEEMIALGVNHFIACGGCGVLDHEIAAGHVMVLESAVRDEGTSYHYMAPGREARPGPLATQTLMDTLEARQTPHRRVKAWTTDAIYRETLERREKRLAEGCSVVEMEAAAFFAVAQFRGIEFGQLVYGGDVVVPEGWDKRHWDKRSSDRLYLFELAADACLNLGKRISGNS